MSQRRIRVLIVSESLALLTALSQVCKKESDLQCVDTLSSVDELVTATRKLKPDIILIGQEMPDSNMFDAIEDLLRALPTSRIVVYSGLCDEPALEQARKIGIRGCIDKQAPLSEVLDEVRRLAAD